MTFAKADENANQFMTDFRANALVAVLARNEADLGALPGSGGMAQGRGGTVAAWTDDYSDIMGAILRKKLSN